MVRVKQEPAVDFPPPSFVDLSGFRMAYREWGPVDAARTVVLLHGIASSSLSWIAVAPALARRHRVLAVDLRGHGESGRPATGNRIVDQARDAAEFCVALGLGRPAVVGHSWGGAVALQLATSTDLVGRLVLEEPAFSDHERDLRQWAQAQKRFAGWRNLSRPDAERRASAYLARGWTETHVVGGDRDPFEAFLREPIKVDAAIADIPAEARTVFAENGPWRLHELAPELRCPTLLLYAAPELGGCVDPEALALARANRHVRAVLVAGADHSLHFSRFEGFMAVVEPFLAGQDA